jgi:hypothetical protein
MALRGFGNTPLAACWAADDPTELKAPGIRIIDGGMADGARKIHK